MIRLNVLPRAVRVHSGRLNSNAPTVTVEMEPINSSSNFPNNIGIFARNFSGIGIGFE